MTTYTDKIAQARRAENLLETGNPEDIIASLDIIRNDDILTDQITDNLGTLALSGGLAKLSVQYQGLAMQLLAVFAPDTYSEMCEEGLPKIDDPFFSPRGFKAVFIDAPQNARTLGLNYCTSGDLFVALTKQDDIVGRALAYRSREALGESFEDQLNSAFSFNRKATIPENSPILVTPTLRCADVIRFAIDTYGKVGSIELAYASLDYSERVGSSHDFYAPDGLKLPKRHVNYELEMEGESWKLRIRNEVGYTLSELGIPPLEICRYLETLSDTPD